MSTLSRRLAGGWALLLGALILAGGWRSADAQCIPGASINLTRPTGGAQNLAGWVRVEFNRTTPPPSSWQWNDTVVRIYSGNGDPNVDPIVEEGYPTEIGTGTGEFYYEWDTTLRTNGTYTIYAIANIDQPAAPFGHAQCWSSPVTVTLQNPYAVRHADRSSLFCPCRCDAVSTGSSTSPLSGHQSFTVPITSWNYKGATFPFALEYNSHALVDPRRRAEAPEFNGLSEKNSHWSHPYAMWIDLFQDESGKQYAVWHHGGSALAFEKSGTNFLSPDSSNSLTFGGGPITSPLFSCRGVPNQTLQLDYGYFIVKDGAGTSYEFNYLPPMGQTHLLWQTNECQAIPYYLLTRIRDRWGRILNITWSSDPAEPRVTQVRDAGGVGLTLNYTDGLLTSVQDAQGRTHFLTYTSVPDETGTNRQKLTGVTVYGPGSPNRTVRTWSFAYRDAADPDTAYGNSYTGDLVIQRTEPDGRIVNYAYEKVHLVGLGNLRPADEDWEGRVSQISWSDPEGAGGARVITRTGGSASQAQLTFPGGAAVQYNYTGEDLTAVTDLSTGRVWSYTFDAKHNLTSTRSPLEPAGNPLVQYDYLFDTAGLIDQVTARVRQADGSLGDPVETQFNDLNEPIQVKAYARLGSGRPDAITQMQYDGGALTVGNLTKIIEGFGTAQQQETNLFYDAPDGTVGLPTRIRNELGAESTLDYHDTTGLLLSAASPPNLVVPVGHPDRPASVTTLAYNGDSLPSLVTDPEGHQVGISYNAASAGSPNLVVTLTFGDTSTRTVTLDAMGRPIEARDELGVRTQWTYTPSAQVKTTRRAVGTADERLTTMYYDSHEDLSAIDPPAGSTTRVQLEYGRYNPNGTLEGTYEGQVTRILYADATSEYLGYNDAGELAWRRKPDGSIVSLTRDELHRVKQIDYPASGSFSAFSVTTAFDEFGRVSSTTDATGTTSLVYDVLDRLTSLTPPSPQQALAYSYSPDTTLQRWITTLSVTGVGTYEYREDTKGRLSQVINPFSQSFWSEFDKDGKNTLLLHPNGVQEIRSYTPRDWLGAIQIKKSNGTIADTLSYYYTDGGGVYDPTGHLRREVDAGGRTHAFFYDNLYELISESHPDIGTVGYQYSLNGSRTRRTTSAGIDYYGVDAANKLLWVNRGVNLAPTSGQASPYTLYQQDADGRMSRRERKYAVGGTIQTYDFLWDGDDRLRQVKQGVSSRFSASYNGDGLRASKTDLFSATYHFTWGPGGVLYDGATTYTPGLAQRQGTSASRFSHSDWVGSTRYLSENTGLLMPSALRYDAFGQRTALSGPTYPTPYQFAGGWGYEAEYSDASEPYLGLEYVDQRYYEPATGRFISPDPIGFDGGLNLFAYCGNDPANNVDPEGLYGIWVGGVHLGDDHPWLVFDAQGAAAGLGTGVAAVGSAGSFGLWDGGDAQCQPGFGTSRALAAFGRDILLWEAGGALLGRAAPLLSRIPRPALRLRPGFLRIPGLGSGGGQATGQLHHVLSRKIWRQAVRNPALRAALQRNSPRFLARARDLLSHFGYQQWHRALDREIVTWLQANRNATVDEFVQHLRDLYAHPSLQHRFPGYPGP